jgi:tetratricopeptide (TPR) repeat protein
MDALEPLLGRVHKDLPLADRRLEKLAAEYPRDVESLDWEGLLDFARPDIARNAARRATELDPLDGQAWQALGRWAVLAGDLDDARSAFEQGSSVATDSIDNLVELGLLNVGSGRCDEAERAFQRATDLDPAGGLRPLASIRAALGRPAAAVRELLEQYVKALPAAAQPLERTMADVDMAVATGDFDKALSVLERSADLIATNTEYAAHEAHTIAKVRCLLESGDTHGARDAAREFAVRSEAWTRLGSLGGDGDLDRVPWLARVASGAVDFESTRAKWVDEKVTGGSPPALIWALGWAAPATTPSEAKAAVAALAEDHRLAVLRLSQSGLYGFGMVDAYVGHAYLLAGRPDEAVAYLDHATRACTGLSEQFDQVHAQWDLGVALEQRGDVAGACTAYRGVVAKWGHATPRSETAETAKDAMRRLSCTQ